MREWRGALEDPHAFAILLETSWLPTVQRNITNDWNPHDCESALAILETWQSLIPDEMLQYRILDGLILPRLQVSY